MSVRQAEKDVEVEVGHVEEKNAVVEVVESVTGGENAEKVDKIDRKYQKLKSKLIEFQIMWEVERENLLEELESEREKAQKLSESQERLKRKVVKLEKTLVAEKQVSEDMKSHLKVWQERSKDDHERKQKIHETWRKPRRASRSSTSSSEAPSWENRSETKTDTSRRSEVRDMMDGMRRMMRAQALPEPRMFDGEGDFGEFKRAFLLKYNNVTEGPEEMVAILEDKFLKGPAKTLFKTLPNRHNRSIKSLFEEFERKLRKRQGDSRTKALNEKAYPGVDDGNLSQMRTTKLMMAVKDNENLHNLFIMKRLDYSIEDQYENLKDVVLQQEQEKRQSLKKGHSFLMNDGKMRKDTSWKRSDRHPNHYKEEQKTQ
uniref:Uncharacterized protein n=1 Tax=Caenorhabditis japonica TaxID=281687 RepID=A0A8R1IIH7_CAEJA